MPTANQTNYRSAVGQPWVAPHLKAIAAKRQIALALTDATELNVVNESALFHGYSSLRELVTACYVAANGNPYKNYQRGTLSANLSSCPAAVTSGRADIFTWGWRLRITASSLNFTFDLITFKVGPVTNTAGVFDVSATNLVLEVATLPRRLPLDIFVLSPANAAGLMTVVPGAQNQAVTAGNTSTRPGIVIMAVDANTKGVIETLNQRDLTARNSTPAQYDHGGGNPAVDWVTGIRDAA